VNIHINLILPETRDIFAADSMVYVHRNFRDGLYRDIADRVPSFSSNAAIQLAEYSDILTALLAS